MITDRILLLAAGAALLASLVGNGALYIRANGLQIKLSAEQLARESERRLAAEAAAKGIAEARANEQARIQAQQEALDATQPKLDAALRAAAAVPDLDRRVRDARAALAACRGGAAGNPAAAASGPAADETAGVLAELQRESDEAATVRARYADEAAAAGERCAVMYDSLGR